MQSVCKSLYLRGSLLPLHSICALAMKYIYAIRWLRSLENTRQMPVIYGEIQAQKLYSKIRNFVLQCISSFRKGDGKNQ